MYIIKKINAVNKVFREAEKHVLKFQRHTNISCISGCGICCANPNIVTTIIEFLPGAYSLFISDGYNDILESIDSKTDTLCVFYNPFLPDGCCSQYKSRGLVCRLFGFSAKTTKTGEKMLIACKPIRQSVNEGEIHHKLSYAPEMPDYYLKLYGIDPKLSIQYLPINQAIKKALEIVLFHTGYRKKPA